MRILIATGIYPPDIGGPATYTETVVAECTRRGVSVSVVTYADTSHSKNDAHAVHRISRALPKGIRHAVYFFSVLYAARGVDVVFAQDTVSAGLPAFLASVFVRKPFVVRITGDYAWEQAMQRFGVTELLDDFLYHSYGLRVGILRMTERFVARRARAVIVPSAYLESVVHAWGVAKEHIHVVYNAVEAPHVTMSRSDARSTLGLSGTILLSVGRLVPWKGFSMLIRLMPRIREHIADARLIIIGSGPDEHALKEVSRREHADSFVTFAGSVPRDKLFLYERAADMILFNTGYEGFSHQLLEELMIGVPVIATRAGGNAELIRDGENALVAEYNNPEDWEEKITKLFSDDSLRARLAVPQASATRFTISRMVDETIAVLASHHLS